MFQARNTDSLNVTARGIGTLFRTTITGAIGSETIITPNCNLLFNSLTISPITASYTIAIKGNVSGDGLVWEDIIVPVTRTGLESTLYTVSLGLYFRYPIKIVITAGGDRTLDIYYHITELVNL